MTPTERPSKRVRTDAQLAKKRTADREKHQMNRAESKTRLENIERDVAFLRESISDILSRLPPLPPPQAQPQAQPQVLPQPQPEPEPQPQQPETITPSMPSNPPASAVSKSLDDQGPAVSDALCGIRRLCVVTAEGSKLGC